MSFRRVATFYGTAVACAGVLLMGWGPMLLKYFGTLVIPDNGSYSLIRLCGVGFLFAGALLLAVRDAGDPALQRRIGIAMAAAHAAGGLIVWSQQSAIWGTPLGLALTVWFLLAPLWMLTAIRPATASLRPTH